MKFIAHQGVHLASTVAGENSLESARLAARAGFPCIEFDVHLSADGVFVVVHDATLNRTFLARDGSPLREPVRVADLTLVELREGYVLRADDPACRTPIPTLEEFLVLCAERGLVPFIELKLKDQPRHVYADLLALADRILGRDGYVITSNNNANRIIRDLGIDDVRLMGILYQTTFEEIEDLGDTIMAISLTRFTPEQHRELSTRAHAVPMHTEAHADNAGQLALAVAHRIEYLSTDVLAPPLRPDARIIASASLRGDGCVTAPRIGLVREGGSNTELPVTPLLLNAGESVSLEDQVPPVELGGIFLEVTLSGACEVTLGPQTFVWESAGLSSHRHQLLLPGTPADFRLTALTACSVERLELTVAAF